MTAPRPDLASVVDGHSTWIATEADRPRRRLWGAVRRFAARVRARLVAPMRLLPGLAGAGCAFAGSWLLWSLGVALLVAAGLLLALDARTPAR